MITAEMLSALILTQVGTDNAFELMHGYSMRAYERLEASPWNLNAWV